MAPRVIEQRPNPGPQTQFLATRADICIYGGSAGGGKSHGLLLEPLRHTSNGRFGAVIFRKTYANITKEGSLWDASMALYPPLGGKPTAGDLYWRWPSGARVSFGHLQHDKAVHDYHGSQIPLIEFDELTEFSAYQFWYMLSRNRSLCGVPPYVRGTCNPDVDSWVAALIAWWIDRETGFPIAARGGVLRWFVRVRDELVWADCAEELRKCYPELPPKSLTFIPAKLSDNQPLMEADPGYLANLLALPEVERQRLLGGNWKVKRLDGPFQKEWFRHYDRLGDYYVLGGKLVRPQDCRRFCTVDLACSAKTTADYTVIAVWDDTKHGDLVLAHLVRKRLEGPDLVPELSSVWLTWRPRYLAIEQGLHLPTLQEARRRGLPIKDLHAAGKDKLERSLELQVRMKAGNVWFPAQAPYLSDLEAELLSFPDSAHDDAVDVCGYAAQEMVSLYANPVTSRPFGVGGMGSLHPGPSG